MHAHTRTHARTHAHTHTHTGAYINNLALMFTGRFIFGIGGESLMVAQNCYTVKWFGENERNFVFGLQISMSRIVS